MLRALLYIIICITSLTTRAQNDTSSNESDSITHHALLHDVRITATRSSDDADLQSIIPPQQLDGENLARLSSLSVADALRHFAGVQVKDYGGIGGLKTVNVRSLGSEHIGVYYDGIQLTNAQNGQIDLGQYALDNVDLISLYNGQRSALMQTASDYANAGNIYIRTRRPSFTDGETHHLRLRLRYGQARHLTLSTLYERRISSTISTSLSVGTTTTDGRYSFRYRRTNTDGSVAYDTTAIRRNGDVQAIRAEGNVYGTLSHGSWHAKAYSYISSRGIPGAIVNNVWRRGERQSDTNIFLQGSMRRDISDSYSMRFMAKYAHYATHYVNRDSTTYMADNHYKQREAYISTTHTLRPLTWLGISAACDVRRTSLTADTNNCPEPVRVTCLTNIATSITTRHFLAQASLLYTYSHDHTRLNNGNQTTNASTTTSLYHTSRLTPALYMSYNPMHSRRLTMHGYIKGSFRMPSFNELYYADMGNSYLRPERATQYSIGVRYETPQRQNTLLWTIQADGYHNTITDKIIAYPKGQQFRWTMLNIGKASINGLDIATELQGHVGNTLIGLRAQYTYMHAIDVSDPNTSYYHHQIPYTPRHSGSITLHATHRGLTFAYTYIYTGERYSQQENTVYNRMQPWYTSDIMLSYCHHTTHHDITATLEVNNALNQNYDVILNYPMPGRNIAFSLALSLGR